MDTKIRNPCHKKDSDIMPEERQIIDEPEKKRDDFVKLCCADLYQQTAVKFFLGNSFHPGGMALTRKLAEELSFSKEKLVLDIGCGEGTTVFFLADNFGCKLTGIDSSEKAIKIAIEENKNPNRIAFQVADAENLPFPGNRFDAVLTECVFSTFSQKEKCAGEIFRVLKPGGLWGMSDMLVEQNLLPETMKGLLFQAVCIGEALNLKEYEKIMMDHGFQKIKIEDVSWALEFWMDQIEKKLLAAKLLAAASNFAISENDLKKAQGFLEQGKELVRGKIIGYGILIGEKP